MNRLFLVVGGGRCGLLSLVHVLNRQPGAKVSFEEPPLLPWKADDRVRLIRERFARWRRTRGPGVLGDAAPFYLPYLEDALAAEPDLRVIGLKRPRGDGGEFRPLPRRVQLVPDEPLGGGAGPGLVSRPALDALLPPVRHG